MAILSQDQIGDLGELLAAAALSRPVGGRFNRPLFRATSLGGKYPTVDFLVDLLAPDESQTIRFPVENTIDKGGIENLIAALERTEEAAAS